MGKLSKFKKYIPPKVIIYNDPNISIHCTFLKNLASIFLLSLLFITQESSPDGEGRDIAINIIKLNTMYQKLENISTIPDTTSKILMMVIWNRITHNISKLEETFEFIFICELRIVIDYVIYLEILEFVVREEI